MSVFRLPNVVSGLSQSVQHLSNVMTGKGRDGRFFQSTRKGEIQELKEDLHSNSKEKKKETIKRVIAAMTIGKDVSTLFPDVVNCMQTNNIELKKLVYLYVINYAKVQPELAVLAINTFRKDSLDSNPLIRALAVRTMGCIRLDQVVEYLLEPLRRACKDSDPYVRKTAATCICKLYDTAPETVEEQGLIEILQEMILDTNPTVLANAVASLSEISETANQDYLNLTEMTVSRLLTALSECSEWGQVFILDALAKYTPSDPASATSILDRVIARLNHANPAVVLSTMRIVIRLLDVIQDEELIRSIQKKMGPPLITLLSAESEVQYVALRNISLIVQKYPGVLANEVKMFFCKYTDPHYVKMEKLDITIRLTNNYNVEQVLQELKEYATEVDVDFVKKTIQAIGHCAIKLDSSAESCVAVLISLIETRVNYVVQQVIVVMKDILRKYQNRYESVISVLCENLVSLDEPEAKASMIWIIGEYAQRIDNADELIESFLASFHEETIAVRHQILTATVKLFLKCPSKSQKLVTQVLKMSTEESDDPDIRDRGFVYWRLLATDPEATKKVVLAPKPCITEQSFYLESEVLDKLLQNLSTLASVFHRVPESFVTRLRLTSSAVAAHDNTSDDTSVYSDGEKRVNREEIKAAISAVVSGYNEGTEKQGDGSEGSPESMSEHRSRKSGVSTASDLLSLDEKESTTDELSKENDILLSMTPSSCPVILEPSTRGTNGATGILVKGKVYRQPKTSKIVLYLFVKNQSPVTLTAEAWALQINKNSFGLSPQNPTQLGLPQLATHESAEAVIPLVANVNLSQTPPPLPPCLEIAIRTSLDIFYFKPVTFDVYIVFIRGDAVTRAVFDTHWNRMGIYKQSELTGVFSDIILKNDLIQRLETFYFSIISVQDELDSLVLKVAAITTNKLLLLFEFVIDKLKQRPTVKITTRADATQMFSILEHFFIQALGIRTSF